MEIWQRFRLRFWLMVVIIAAIAAMILAAAIFWPH